MNMTRTGRADRTDALPAAAGRCRRHGRDRPVCGEVVQSQIRPNAGTRAEAARSRARTATVAAAPISRRRERDGPVTGRS